MEALTEGLVHIKLILIMLEAELSQSPPLILCSFYDNNYQGFSFFSIKLRKPFTLQTKELLLHET